MGGQVSNLSARPEKHASRLIGRAAVDEIEKSDRMKLIIRIPVFGEDDANISIIVGIDSRKTAITNRIIRVILEDANRTEFIDSASAENHRHVGDIAAV